MDIQVQENENNVEVSFSGALGFKDHMAFNEFMTTLQGKKHDVIFDLTRLETIDSAGIGMLFLARDLIKKSNGELSLKNPNGQVSRVFEIAGIPQQIKVV